MYFLHPQRFFFFFLENKFCVLNRTKQKTMIEFLGFYILFVDKKIHHCQSQS